MPRETNWNYTFTLSRELGRSPEGEVYDLATDGEVPKEIKALIVDFREVYELLVEVHCVGYHVPASMYGGADHMGWPEEGDDERTVTCLYLVTGCCGKITRQELPKELHSVVEEWLATDIQEHQE